MRMLMKILAGGAGFAAIAAAAPSSAQYGYSYGNGYGYGAYGMNTNIAAQQCTAAVQQRLYNRSSIGGILGAFLGANTTGRVVSITQVTPRSNGLRVRGLATAAALLPSAMSQRAMLSDARVLPGSSEITSPYVAAAESKRPFLR